MSVYAGLLIDSEVFWLLPHHSSSGSGVVLWLGGGAGGQGDITASFLPVKGLVLSDDSLLHAVFEH